MQFQDKISQMTEKERRELARTTVKAFKLLENDELRQVRLGKDKSHSVNLLKILTARNIMLRAIGYEINSESGRLVKFRIHRPLRYRKMQETSDLLKKGREGMKELLRLMELDIVQ